MVSNKLQSLRTASKTLSSILYVFLVLAFLYLPILFIIIFSFSTEPAIDIKNVFTLKFSLDNYVVLFSKSKMMPALINSLVLALCTSILSCILGTAAAIGIYNSKNKVKNTLNNISQIPVLNAEIVTAVSLSLLFITIGMPKGFATLLIAHTTFCTPYVVLSVMPKLKQMNKNTYEAALDLGATPRQALMKIIIPEIIPGILTGFVLAFTLSIDDFVVTVFNTSSFDTLSKYIYDTVAREGLKAELRALSALMFAVVLSILLIINLKANKKKERL